LPSAVRQAVDADPGASSDTCRISSGWRRFFPRHPDIPAKDAVLFDISG